MAAVSIDKNEDPADPNIKEAKDRLTALNTELTAMIAALPPKTRIEMADGKVLTGADVAKLWKKVHFVITNKTFGPGYGGSFDYASGTSYIRAETVNGWDIFPSGGEFITLHELIHSCKHGEAVRRAMWTKYHSENKHKADYAKDYFKAPEFSEVEEYCYFGARAIMRKMNIADFEGVFDHGYEYGDLLH